MYEMFEGILHLQKQGVCTSSCISRFLRDPLLAQFNYELNGSITDKNVLSIFQNVSHDYLIVLNRDLRDLEL